MKPIIGNAIVSCYVDAASLLVMILLLILLDGEEDILSVLLALGVFLLF